jgi:hypothetical protein
MKALVLAIMAIGLAQAANGFSRATAPASQRAGKGSPDKKQGPQNSQSATMPPGDQPPSIRINTTTNQPDEDRDIQRKIKDFTFWLVVVGAIQALVLAGQAVLFFQQKEVMEEHKTKFDELAKAANSNAQASILQVQAMQGQITEMSIQSELMKTSGTHTEQLARQAVKQSDLTQRQFDLTNRPWISIDFVKPISNLEFRDSGDVLVWFGYQIKNVGHSVAQHIVPWIEPIVTGVGDPLEVRTRISNQLKRPIDSPFDHGKLIFPNQVITDRYPLMIRPNDLANALDKSPFKDRDGGTVRGIGLEIFACFDYQSTLDSSNHYQTQSMYLLSYRGNGLFLQSQKIYGADGLGLVFKGFGAYAD